jgi:hypothetical protein
MNYNTLISIMPKVAIDTDAQAFITASGISGINSTAINTLVIDLKNASLWNKMKAIYPFVGNTSASQKYNLKDARDLDIAYRLTFIGGGTFSSNGYQGNSVNGYANTFLNSSTDLTNTSNHISYYSRTATVGTVCEIGTFDGSPNTFFQLRSAANYASGNLSSVLNFTTTGSALGFWLGTKRSNTDREIYRNGISEATNTTSDTSPFPNINILLNARNAVNNSPAGAQLFSNKECAFSSIGDGLTDAEAVSLYNIVQNFNTTLSRQV